MTDFFYAMKNRVQLKKRVREFKRSIKMRELHFRNKRNQNMVVFCSFRGKQYSDNPKAISEKLKEMRPETEIVWLLQKNDPSMRIPDYVRVVKYDSNEAALALAQAKVWVYNNDLPYGTYKGADQYYVQTWHGDRGFKRVRYDAQEAMGMAKYKALNMVEPKICDLCVAGSDEGESKYRTAFHYQGEILVAGCPRNDVLLEKNEEQARDIKSILGIKEEKILLYAPTFRGNGKIEQKANIDFSVLVNELEKITRNPWKVLVRAHTLTAGFKADSHNIMDVSDYRDMAELLLITDLLISDFSSTINDYALLRRPIILYLEDFDDYVRHSRALKVDMAAMGYLIAYNMDDLLKIVRNIHATNFAAICDHVLENYGTKESGQASKAVCERIINWLSE